MSSTLQLILLGSPEVVLDGRRLDGFITVKSRALLYYLVVKPGVHSRQTLATLLWPQSSDAAAAKNLRNVLSNLRQLVGEHLDITRQMVAFRRNEPYSLDVEQYTAFLAHYRHNQGDIGALENAIALYGGDFLEGFHVADTELFEEWMVMQREQLIQAQLAALLTVAARYAAESNLHAALDYVSQLIVLDNLNESGLQLKMSVLAQMGQRSEAVAQYRNFYQLLEDALGMKPLEETTALYEWIKAGLSAPSGDPVQLGYRVTAVPVEAAPPRQPAPKQMHALDWGEIPAPVSFYGRQVEMQKLREWVTNDRAHLIAVIGIGGVGKSALVARFAREQAALESDVLPEWEATQSHAPFKFIIWRSLINVPPLEAILQDWLMLLSGRQLPEIPAAVADQLKLLTDYIQTHRSLFVLDNFESLMQDQDPTGSYRSGFEDYEQLLRLFANAEHQSCLIITGRELPKILRRIQRETTLMRPLQLSGLSDESGVRLLRASGLSGSDTQLAALVRQYSGNPLALNLVVHTVHTLFGGSIELLQEDIEVFGDVREVLDEQFGRLTPLEKQVLAWLAVEREPIDFQTLWDNLASKPHKRELLEALQSLHFRALLEYAPGARLPEDPRSQRYTLQNVIMEHTTSRLVEAICREIETAKPKWLQQVALVKVHAREFVQDTQRRLLLDQVVGWLTQQFATVGAEERLRRLLEMTRSESSLSVGYTGANLLHLFMALDTDLSGYDFAGLTIKQADLRTAVLQNVSFRECSFDRTIFRDMFGLVLAVAFSPDGQMFASLSASRGIMLWRIVGQEPHQVIQRVASLDFDTAYCMAFRPDGRVLACGGSNGVIRLYDVQTGYDISRLTAHTAQVTAVIFSPDGSRLYSSSQDLTIGIWDADRGKLLRKISAPGIFTTALAVSPDGRILAAVGYDGAAQLWQIDSWKLLRRLEFEHTKAVRTLAFSPDGNTLATGDDDNTVCVWHVGRGTKLASHRLHSNSVLAIAYHPAGAMLASAGADKTIKVWNWHQERMVHLLPGAKNWVTSLAFSPDGKLLLSSGYDHTIRVWESASGHLVRVLQGFLQAINEVAFSPDGRLLASSSFDRPVHLWDVENGRALHTFQGHTSSVRQLTFSADSRTLIISGDDSTIWFWNTHTGKLERTLSVDHQFVRTLAVSRNGRYLAVGAGLNLGKLYIGAAPAYHLQSRDDNIRVGIANRICFSPNEQILAFSDQNFAIKLLNVKDGTVHLTPTSHKALIGSIHYSPDGSLLASQDREGTLILWQVENNGSLTPLAKHLGSGPTANYWSLAFSPNGKFLAFPIDGNRLGIIETNSGQLLCTIAESLFAKDCLAFSTDGSALITSSKEGSLRLWDAPTGKLLTVLQQGIRGMIDVNPKNGLVASSGDDGVIRIWNIQTGVCERELVQPGPYQGMNLTNAKGLSPAQAVTLRGLGAVDDNSLVTEAPAPSA